MLLDLDIAPIDGQEVTQVLRESEKPGMHTPIYALLNRAAALTAKHAVRQGFMGS